MFDRNSRVAQSLITSISLLVLCVFGSSGHAEEWNGFEKVSFKVGERNAFVVVPKMATTGRP